jgi:PPOX class probable F420-dependent enzyme
VNLGEEEARSRFCAARVARLATVGPGGLPHLVPITFAATGDTVATAVDHKPKRGTDLARLRHIRAQPRVSLLADHYEDHWEALWWVRADGVARILDDRDADRARRADALRRLAEKYPQYRLREPAGPIILIGVERWTGWAWAGA